MSEFLLDRPPWFVAGPLVGLIVVAILALLNERMGVLGAYSELVERVVGRRRTFGWKLPFLVGIVAGGLVFGALGGSFGLDGGYGWLSRAFDSDAAVAGGLLAGGVLIGFGAKTAGGCTSGNGLCGTALASPASFAATATFMATAIATSFVTRWMF